MTYLEERNDQNYEFYDFNEINVIWIVFSVKNIHVYPFKNVFVFAVLPCHHAAGAIGTKSDSCQFPDCIKR